MDAIDEEGYSFEGFTLDLCRGCLRRNDQVIKLRPKSFALLCHLARNSGRLLPKDGLIEVLWPSIVVGDESLARCVSDVRLALGDAGQRIVKTVPRRGYLFDVPVHRASTTAPRTSPPASDLPSIAVLPLANLGGDSNQDYLSEGLTDDLITLLSSVPDLSVIAHHSAFAFTARSADAQTVGRELGVRYVLEGSVRADLQRLRVTAHLVDTGTGRRLWAEHYDRAREEVFSVQDEITQRIAGSLVAHVARSELLRACAKPTNNLAAYDFYLRGASVIRTVARGERAERIPEARMHFDQAVAADPSYPRPLLGLAMTFFWTWVEPVDREPLRSEFQQPATLAHAVALAQRAVDLDPFAAEAHARLGYMLHWQQRRAQGMAEYQRAFEINPNLADLFYITPLTNDGRAAEAIEYMERCRRLDPFYSPSFDAHLAHAHYLLGHYDTALTLLRAAVHRVPGFHGAHVWHAATAAQLGHVDEACAAAAQVLHFQPEMTVSKYLGLVRYAKFEDEQRLADGLRKAGLPE